MKQTGVMTHSSRWKKVGICLVLQFLFFGCRPVPPEPLIHPVGHESSPAIIETADLAGTWEYHDENGIFCLKLNQEGNGRYDWQGGRFVTTSLENGRWRGEWFQTKNDREGGFDLGMTSSGERAEGRWWYTRIEDDHAPSQPGGKFTLLQAPCTPSREVNLGSILSDEEKPYAFARLSNTEAVEGERSFGTRYRYLLIENMII